MTREDFMQNTLDVWEIPAESATRIGHPAPFPVEIPARLIELYTYRGDLVLDPFAGSGLRSLDDDVSNPQLVGALEPAELLVVARGRRALGRVARRLLGRHAPAVRLYLRRLLRPSTARPVQSKKPG